LPLKADAPTFNMQVLIGEASRRTGASIKAIRLYESLGLIGVPLRRGRYRLYNDEALETLRCIKQAQGLGFTLREMQALRLPNTSNFDTACFSQAVQTKRAILEELIGLYQKQIVGLDALQRQIASPTFCKSKSQ
jgi:MerR family transcriptional regulator, copper efflux regulator